MRKTVVVGGGAAGIMAAISAADNGDDVVLLEQNEKLGKKIYITGKGRCNVTNNCDAETFFDNVVTNPKFLFSAYYGFDSNMVMTLVEDYGCPLKIERGNRVFPVSDHSSDIIKALSNCLHDKGVKIRFNSVVKGLVIENDTCKGVLLGKEIIEADKVIVATGGKSYASTGSTGDGLNWAKECGHDITECRPALVPFVTKEEWVKELQGLALKNTELTLMADGKKIWSGFGEMLFTHFGISGPLVLSASSYYAKSNRNKKYEKVSVRLDMKNALSEDQLDKRIIKDFEKYSNKQFKNALSDLLPSKLIPVIINLSGIDPDKKVNLVTKEERKKIVSLLKGLEITIDGTRGFNEAIITQGGISIKNINPSTMESKVIDNLFFAGEIIDVDALTGGFNLQIAFSTGHLAGEE